MSVDLVFDSEKGYGRGIKGKVATKEDYLSLPVIKWCHEKVGPLKFPKDPNEILTGDGWEIYSDWNDILYKDSVDLRPGLHVIIHKEINSRLITEFWMKFGL